MTHCEICDKIYCCDCSSNTTFCKECNGCQECVNDHNKGCCGTCLERHCDECRPVVKCSTCLTVRCQDCLSDDPQMTMSQCGECDLFYCSDCMAVNHCNICESTECADCIAMVLCNDCGLMICTDCRGVTICVLCKLSMCDNCQSVSKCSLCAKGCCHACSSSYPQHSMLQCTDCSEPFCSECGYVHEIGTNPPNEETDMFLTALMDTGGGLLAATEGPVTRSAVNDPRCP